MPGGTSKAEVAKRNGQVAKLVRRCAGMRGFGDVDAVEDEKAFCRRTKKGRLRSHASVSCFALLSRLGAKVIETAAMGSSFHANGQKAPNASHRPNTSPGPTHPRS